MHAANEGRLLRGSDGAPTPTISAWMWASRAAATEFFAVFVTAYLTSIIYHKIVFDTLPSTLQYLGAALLLAACFSLLCFVDDQYDIAGEKWIRRGISRGAGAAALAFVFFLCFSFLFKIADDYSRGTFLLQVAFVFPVFLSTRTLLIRWLERAIAKGKLDGRRLVVVSLINPSQHSSLARKLGEAPDRVVRWHSLDAYQNPIDLSGRTSLSEMLSAIRQECRKNRADIIIVVFSAANAGLLSQVVEAFSELPANIQLLPVELAPFMQRTRISESGRVSVLETNFQPSLAERGLKRMIDLILSTLGLILLLPLLILVAIAIKLDSRGPVLFRQIRHGFNNEPIEVLKFRSMAARSEKEFRQTERNDPRITRIGALLRKTNIDELPQLLNVIRGEMSLVGPRPHAVEHNDTFAKQIRLLNRRHSVKPGITGWAQVNGFRGATDTYEKMQIRLEHDLYYVDHWSFFLDVKILLMTVFSKSAYRNAY